MSNVVAFTPASLGLAQAAEKAMREKPRFLNVDEDFKDQLLAFYKPVFDLVRGLEKAVLAQDATSINFDIFDDPNEGLAIAIKPSENAAILRKDGTVANLQLVFCLSLERSFNALVANDNMSRLYTVQSNYAAMEMIREYILNAVKPELAKDMLPMILRAQNNVQSSAAASKHDARCIPT